MDITPLLGRESLGREQAIELLRDQTLMIVSGRRLLITLITGTIGQPDQWLGAATCEEQGLALLARQRPDLLFVTDPLEAGSGYGLVKRAKQLYPDLACLLLLERDTPDILLAALESNCDAICLERMGLGNLVAAIRAVIIGGEVYMDASVAAMLHRTRREWIKGEPQRLTPRELQVLEEMLKGFKTREIAARLFISLETVRSHSKAMLAKLKARSRIHAAVIALRLGLVRLDLPDAADDRYHRTEVSSYLRRQ
ncbi:response regulator transcription factor [Synechococcus sp. Tobar12-5m-g]|jgi:DNA-binding NarL/FixJ family response regulator|uniref:response regulator transcription factor n=1 Tax=unclassified Synechococcus TaxID=2626047 RepID=UPI0020CFA1AB|nr:MULTISPECIES: response regulator transcription factor [unclassified Synechococcus]MCP9771844.1 response regulator transcription factor [Synechococcus sp. Tobar12-5m-g]MCP9872786.1 response regulator transcription factor [Synechococcus sp. Cruz CV-v-12]